MLVIAPLRAALGRTLPREVERQEDLYRQASTSHGAALERLARGYERDEDRRQDLLQEIHVALWRSFASFDGRCSLRTWVYRVAHNVAASRVAHAQRQRARPWLSLAELEASEQVALPHGQDAEAELAERHALERLLVFIHQLGPIDRQLMLLYLEGLDAASIGEVTGHSAANVATKVHRIKQVLVKHFAGGDRSAT